MDGSIDRHQRADIYDGKTKLILGLIWSLMLKYQIQNRKQILEWTQEVLNGRSELHIENLDSRYARPHLQQQRPTTVDTDTIALSVITHDDLEWMGVLTQPYDYNNDIETAGRTALASVIW